MCEAKGRAVGSLLCCELLSIKRSKTSSAIQNVVVLIKTFGHAYLLCIVVADLQCTNEFHWMPNVKSSPCRKGGCVFR